MHTPPQDINRDDIVRLLHAFYAAVRTDPELKPLFESEIDDWDAYLELMADFWCGALVEGAGRPVPSPPGLLYGFTRTGLARWDTLFIRATEQTLRREQATRLRRLAQEIGARQSGL